jgi:hypothetical protein
MVLADNASSSPVYVAVTLPDPTGTNYIAQLWKWRNVSTPIRHRAINPHG